MDSNTHSNQPPKPLGLLEPPEPLGPPERPEPLGPPERPEPRQSPGPPESPERSERSAGRSGRLAGLPAVLSELAAEDLDQLTDSALTQDTLELQRLLDGLAGQWLRRLAATDTRGAAGADQGQQAASTAGWLRNRLRLGAGAAREAVRTARALFRGPLPGTAQALTDGQISPAHAQVLAQSTRHLPDHVTREAEPVLVEAAIRLDPPQLRQAVGYLLEVADPDGADAARQRCHDRRGLWLSPTLDDMVAVNGLLEPEAGATVLAALEPLARPADADDTRLGGQRTADALTELCRRALEGGQLPKAGGVRPQLLVTVDLDSLLGRPGGLGGDLGWAGPLDPEACRRLACDAAVIRVVVTRHPDHPDLDAGYGADPAPASPPSSRPGCRPPWPCCPRPWAAPPANRWTSAAPPGSSPRPNGPPWRCGTAAACSRAASGPWPGATPIICGIGSMVARPTWRTWPWCAGPTTGASMRAAGS
jgi:hypothetical protein